MRGLSLTFLPEYIWYENQRPNPWDNSFSTHLELAIFFAPWWRSSVLQKAFMSIENRAMRRKETESSRSWSELSSTHRCRMRGIPGKKEDEWFPDIEIARSLPRKPVRILMYQTSCYLRLVRSILSFIPSSIRPDRLSSPFWVNAQL